MFDSYILEGYPLFLGLEGVEDVLTGKYSSSFLSKHVIDGMDTCTCHFCIVSNHRISYNLGSHNLNRSLFSQAWTVNFQVNNFETVLEPHDLELYFEKSRAWTPAHERQKCCSCPLVCQWDVKPIHLVTALQKSKTIPSIIKIVFI